jgi:ribonuclease J
MLMEGSSLSRLAEDGHFPLEKELEIDLANRLRDKAGLVMVHISAQNIDRIVTLYRVAKKTGRTLVIDLYSAAILAATGHPTIPKSDWQEVALYVPEAQRRQIKKHGWFDLLKSHSSHRIFAEDLKALAPKAMILYRPLLMRDLDKIDCLSGARFIYGQWLGYLEKGSYASTQSWLQRHDIKLEYLHTSGHASPVDLKRFAKALSPRALVPIHSFAPEQYPKLFDNVTPRADGEWWSI